MQPHQHLSASNSDPCCAIVVAAGQGNRARTTAKTEPKQFAQIGSKPVIEWTLAALSQHPCLTKMIVVVPVDKGSNAQLASTLRDALPTSIELHIVAGGATRQESVFKGLLTYEATRGLETHPQVLVHDGARPFVTPNLVERILSALNDHTAVVPVLPVTDTLKRIDGTHVYDGPDRSQLAHVQTPQGFHGQALVAAHKAAHTSQQNDTIKPGTFTDDASILAWHGTHAHGIAGEDNNIKITRPEDWSRAQAILDMKNTTPSWEVRTGLGYDVHRLVPGDGVWLCGHFIAHTHKLDGHSDADVGLHALTDALLGTINAGDIGTHFPPSDPQWKGARSDRFLRYAAELVRNQGGSITNVDVTLVAEMPKIGPHRQAMQQAISAAIDLPVSRISIKATTNEKMGFAGRQEGIAAMATACIMLENIDD